MFTALSDGVFVFTALRGSVYVCVYSSAWWCVRVFVVLRSGMYVCL